MQYHASMALGPQLILFYCGLKIVAQHPVGENGNRLKLCGPSKTLYADSWGWVRDVRIIFNVSCDYLIQLHHSTE